MNRQFPETRTGKKEVNLNYPYNEVNTNVHSHNWKDETKNDL